MVTKASISSENRIELCQGRVINSTENEVTLIISRDIKNKLSEEMIVTLYDDIYGLLLYKAIINEYQRTVFPGIQEAYRVSCTLLEKIEQVQRREDLKVKIRFMIEITLLDMKLEPLLKPDGKTPIKYSAYTSDISASGVLFISSEKLPIGQIFTFIFDKDINNPIEVIAEIIRTQDMIKGDIGYGCRFINTKPKNKEDIIRRYVFNIQLRNEGKLNLDSE